MKSLSYFNFRIEYLILFSIVTMALVFSSVFGTNDMNYFISWVQNAVNLGISKGYEANAIDYPPLSTLILFLGYQGMSIISVADSQKIKFILIIFLLITFFVMKKISNNIKLSIFLTISLFLSSAALGYIDILFTPSLLASFYFLRRENYLGFSIFYILSIFIKWQPIILLPFVFIYLIAKYNDGSLPRKTIFLHILNPAILITSIILFFYGVIPVLKAFIYASLFHNYLSANALNFNWLVTWFLKLLNPDKYGFLSSGQISYINQSEISILNIILRLIFLTIFLAILLWFSYSVKTFDNLVLYSGFGYYSYFMFNIGVHENHLFLLIPLLCLHLPYTKDFTWLLLAVSMIFNINLYLFYGLYGSASDVQRVLFNFDLSLIFVIINFIIFIKFFVYIKKSYKTTFYSRRKFFLG